MVHSSSFKYTVGIHNASSFVVPGTPWISGSTVSDGKQQVMRFPTVAKSVTVYNDTEATTAGSLRVHVQSGSNSCTTNGTDNAIAVTDPVIDGKHYVVLSGSQNSITLTQKMKEIYVSANGSDINYTVSAVLTNIPAGRMFDLTGSGINYGSRH
tara:strand:- start:2699 stop:3160 length:462 start_codon:yes stop_codon:yes gene_type:complete